MNRPHRATKDKRIVYGARCFWWDSIDRAGRTPPGPSGISLPCCPFCGSVLMEVPDLGIWWRGNRDAIDEGRAPADHLALLRWSRGKCFPTLADARAAWLESRN